MRRTRRHHPGLAIVALVLVSPALLALGEAILVSRLAGQGREERARAIDGWARWLYPLLFALHLTVSLGVSG